MEQCVCYCFLQKQSVRMSTLRKKSNEKIGPLNPPQFDIFRVMVRYKPKGEFDMFDEYSDRQVAENLAKELVASRRVIKSEVIRPARRA
jgi:hypothetical protein